MTRSDKCGQLKRVDETTSRDKVPGGIQVRCRMCAHVDVCKFRHIAVFVGRRLRKTHTWMAGPDGCRIGCCDTDIDWVGEHDYGISLLSKNSI